MKKLYIIITLLILTFTGCGSSSKYNYTVKPTPLKAKSTKYSLRTFNFKYFDGTYAIENNKNYLSEKDLENLFKSTIIDQLKKRHIYTNASDAEYFVDIDLNYTRNYYWGGFSLMKPYFKHIVKVYNSNNVEIASHKIRESEPKYSYFIESLVSAQILAGLRLQEGELEDIEFISELLVEDLAQAGN